MPPFRAEHIGSLLRPPALLELRRRRAAGAPVEADLAAAEDAAIRAAVEMQRRLGFRMVTDGELRRQAYHSYFFGQLGDVTLEAPSEPGDSGSAATRGAQPLATIGSRLQWTAPIHVADFQRLKALTTATPKITIPGPCALHFRGGDKAILAHGAYKDVDAFWADIVEAFTRELAALAAAGCTYVQIDETAFAKFSDPKVRETLKARGDDWSRLIDFYVAITNRVLAAAPKSLRIGMHLCRGNRAGQFHAEGGYDDVAERLFNALEIPFYFLEYDSPRAGGFSALRHVPASKHVVLGLVSTKSGTLESRDLIRSRIDEATRHIPLERLSISPQCGFASIDAGNPLTVAEQEAKLELVASLAQDVWGST